MVQKQFYPSPHVRYVWLGDRVVMLDLFSESYFALDPLASSMWRQLTASSDRDERQNLIDQYGDDLAGLEADLDTFAQRCVNEGLLTKTATLPPKEAQANEGAGRSRGLLTVRAWWSLLCITRSLTKQGFFHTYNALSQMAAIEEVPSAGPEEFLAAAVKAFARAENFFYLRKAPQDCLHRSLALFRFLRVVGLPVEHLIGVQQFPFQAHAWTEYQGEVLRDDPVNQDKFTVIARISA
jgi:hypothetical protein